MSDTLINVREGSSLHYSLLWTAEDARDRFIKRLTLIRAMSTTLDDVQEPQVAEKKIHWWHEELQRLHEGKARHPATKQSQSELQGNTAAQSACLDIVSVASTQRFTAAATTASSEAELIRSFLARLALLSHALSRTPEDIVVDSHADKVALALALHDQLVRLPSLIHRGLPVFSDELYKQFNTRPHDLAEHIKVANPEQPTSALKRIPVVTEKPGRQQLLVHAIEHCRQSLNTAISDSDCHARYRQKPLLPLWRLLILHKHQLDLWSRNQPDLLRERTTLTPLIKLFRAWQHRR